MHFLPPASACSYLPNRMARLEYHFVQELSQAQYHALVQQGWRRFGCALFRPRCPACTACQPIRVVVADFQPDRNQRRTAKLNADTELIISTPTIDEARVDLYFRHHQHHSEQKGWHQPDSDVAAHIRNITDGPLPVLEFAYFRQGKLVAISYIDDLGEAFSGIYFYHDPDYRKYSLGTWICISLIEEAARRGLPYVYLGYYVEGCRSMEYKGKFTPNQILSGDGKWSDFRS